MKHNYVVDSVVPVSDGAAYFNGTSDYIAIGAKPVDTADATYCFWALSGTTGDNRAVFSHGSPKVGEFSINHDTTNQPLLYLNDNLYSYWVDTGFADDSKWHHWAVVVNVDSMPGCKLYIDGVEITQGSVATEDTVTSYGNLEIGRSSSSLEYEGYLCNFGVWAGLLDQAEIKSIMNKSYAELSSDEKSYKGGLQAWWNLDVETATDGTAGSGGVKDSHGSNHGDLE